MVQVDLITGFLGAGKTTFLRRYAAWWAGQGVKVCVLENDFGAVNVDAMLLQDLEARGVELETISGGCDCDTHQRRMRTKLISMAMRGFERVIVEPSGIFDVDEFFDVLRDEPLDRWYQLGNVIAIVDALLPEELSPQAEYLLASESAWAGSVLLSRCQLASDAQKQGAEAHLARALEACKCSRKFGPEEIIAKDWADLTTDDMARIAKCGYRQASCEKLHFDAHDAFTSAYFLELGLPRAQLEKNIPSLFTDPACGNVLRVKGFVEEDGRWYELNAAADGLTAAPIPQGQQVLIVIGEGLDKAIAEGDAAIKAMRALNDRIQDETISGQIDRLEEVSGKIFDYVKAHPEKLPQIRKFMSYYLPTTLKLLRSYDELSRQGVSGQNITGTMEKVEGMMATIVLAFEKQLDSLFGDQAMDITVLDNMMAREGLTGGDAVHQAAQENPVADPQPELDIRNAGDAQTQPPQAEDSVDAGNGITLEL